MSTPPLAEGVGFLAFQQLRQLTQVFYGLFVQCLLRLTDRLFRLKRYPAFLFFPFSKNCAAAVCSIVVMEISGKYFYDGPCQQNKPYRFLYAARYGSP